MLFLSPPVTLIWALVMFGEPLSWLMGLGTLISGVGILLVVNRRSGDAA